MKHIYTTVLFACSAILLLSACGFHPVYGTNKYTPVGAETRFSQISIGNIPDRDGQFLRNELIDNLHRNGPADQKIYSLNVAPLTEQVRQLYVTIDSDTTRAQLKLLTDITLTNTQTGEKLLQRRIESTAGYNILGSEFTNRVSEQATRQNVLKDIARQIELQLSLYFKRSPEKK